MGEKMYIFGGNYNGRYLSDLQVQERFFILLCQIAGSILQDHLLLNFHSAVAFQ